MAGAETTAGSTMLIRYRTFTQVALVLMTQTTLAFTVTSCDDSRPGQPVPADPSDNASVHEVVDRLEGNSPGSAGLHPTQPSSPVHDGGGPSQVDPGEPGEAPSPRGEPGMAMGGGGMHEGGGMGMHGKSGGMGMHGKSGDMGRGGMMGDDKAGSPGTGMDMGGMAGDPKADSPGMGMDMGGMIGEHKPDSPAIGMADDDTMDMPDNPRSTSHGTSSANEIPTETDELAQLLPESAELLKSGGARFFLDAAPMLELSSAQRTTLEEIAREHAVADERLRVRMAARESDLAQALDSADYDRDAVANIIEATEKLRVRRRVAYLDALTEARDILTRRQRERLTDGNERDESEDDPPKSGDAKRHGKGRHGG